MLRKRLMTARPAAAGEFRWRGHEVSRLEGLSDAVFGFAITLLVVSLEVPHTFTELLGTMRGFGAFAISFALLFGIWQQQYTFFRRYGLQDGATVVLNAVLLFTVLFFVYPLKFLFTFLIDAFTGHLEEGTAPMVESGQHGTMMIIYGLGYFAISAVLALLYLHAYRKRDALGLSPLERHDTWERATANALNAGIGLLSMAIAWVGGSGVAFFAGITYALVGPVMAVHGTIMGARRRRLAVEHAPTAPEHGAVAGA